MTYFSFLRQNERFFNWMKMLCSRTTGKGGRTLSPGWATRWVLKLRRCTCADWELSLGRRSLQWTATGGVTKWLPWSVIPTISHKILTKLTISRSSNSNRRQIRSVTSRRNSSTWTCLLITWPISTVALVVTLNHKTSCTLRTNTTTGNDELQSV